MMGQKSCTVMETTTKQDLISKASLACFKQKHIHHPKITWTPKNWRVFEGGISFFKGTPHFKVQNVTCFRGFISMEKFSQTNRTCWDQQPLRRLGLACCRTVHDCKAPDRSNLMIPDHPRSSSYWYAYNCFLLIFAVVFQRSGKMEKHGDNIIYTYFVFSI